MIPTRYYFGLDLGQAADYSALAIIEKPARARRDDTAPLHCRHLKRWPLRTSYPQIVEDVAKMIRSEQMRGTHSPPVLAVDATGVGPPVVDLFREAFDYSGPFQLVYSGQRERRNEVYLLPVVITGGDTVTRDKHSTKVPKRDLVSVTQVAFQTERLKVASRLREAAVLTNELMSFKVKINLETAHDSYGAWREGSHDDLVLAVCLAVWSADNLRESIIEDLDPELADALASYTGR